MKEQLNRVQFINAMNKYSKVPRYRLEEFLDIFTYTVMQEVANGNKINIQGFGSFEFVERAERQNRNFNGEEIIVKAHKTPKFVPGAEFKRRVIQEPTT